MTPDIGQAFRFADELAVAIRGELELKYTGVALRRVQVRFAPSHPQRVRQLLSAQYGEPVVEGTSRSLWEGRRMRIALEGATSATPHGVVYFIAAEDE